MRAAYWCPVLGLMLAGSAVPVAPASCQPVEVSGTRATGMAGAFVAVADDATAVYWNPAGLGTGDFFSLVVGHARWGAGDEARPTRRRDTSTDLFVGTPPLGVGYYRLQTSGVARTVGGTPGWVASRLVTHQVAVAVAQSVGEHVNLGAAVKVVRGGAGAGLLDDAPSGAALDEASRLPTEGTTRVDADLGLMVRSNRVRAGLVVRNVSEPSFDRASGVPVTLDRQVRAGAAFFPVSGLTMAVDVDLTRTHVPGETWRGVAAGVERRLSPRVVLRGGLRASTSGAARPAVAAGGSVALTSLLHLDAQATRGGTAAPRGWGVAVRAAF